MIRVLNVVRAQHGLRRLRPSRALNRAADAHSRDMLRERLLRPRRRATARRSTAACAATPNARTVGETLAALGQPPRCRAARSCRCGWTRRRTARCCSVPRFRRIGIARRSGMLGGFGMSVVTADFASRV